jgi:CSLREA domain-containing protein
MTPEQGMHCGRSPRPSGREGNEEPRAAHIRRACLRLGHSGWIAILLVLLLGATAEATPQCPGDCNADGFVTGAEIRLGLKIRRGREPLESCPSFDADRDGIVTRDEIRAAVYLRRHGCAAANGGRLRLTVDNPTARRLAVTISGKRLSGPPALGGRETYGPLVRVVNSHNAHATAAGALAPGEWLHRVSVAATGQEQARRTLVVAGGDSTAGWSLFGSVLSVNRTGDDGDGTCDDSCTLRDAVEAAPAREGPVLIRLPQRLPRRPKAIEVTRETPLRLDTPGLTIDGTDAGGEPSPLADFADRVYPAVVRLRTGSAVPNPGGPCGAGGTLRVLAEGVRLVGLSIERVLAPEGGLCRGDQDLVAFDAGSRGSGIETSRLDGGAHAVRSAEVPSGTTLPATGKDCIDTSGTGANGAAAITIENTEIRFCLDRGVKSQSGWLRLRRSWVHHNLRGGLFAQSPAGGSVRGVIEASDNLIERNGLNCPSGDPADCGADQVVARGGASELSAQGALTSIFSIGNVVRDGALHGFLFEDGSEGRVYDSYVCGIHNSAGGKGILTQRASGTENDIAIRGTAVVYNDDAGVKMRRRVGADLGSESDRGGNAFTENGASVRRNVVNALDTPAPVVSAEGNSWEHCYAGNSDSDRCDFATICDRDANNSSGVVDRVDPQNPLPHQGTGRVEVHGTVPSRAVEGGIVRLIGTGFDAISGHRGGVGGDCRALAALNTCAPLNGTCVEFLVDGQWREALDVLAVTPTTVVVRAPLTCTEPTFVRTRRRIASGGEVVSAPTPFCLPG